MARDDLVSPVPHNYDDIYVGGASRDAANIRCRVPVEWTTLIAELVNDRGWPEYRTPQDFYRDAIYHRLEWADRLQRSGKRPLSARARIIFGMAQARQALEMQRFIRENAGELHETIVRDLRDQTAEGNYEGVRETLKEVEEWLTDIPEPWRSRLATEMETYKRRVDSL